MYLISSSQFIMCQCLYFAYTNKPMYRGGGGGGGGGGGYSKHFLIPTLAQT